jgi:hypothetical protein
VAFSWQARSCRSPSCQGGIASAAAEAYIQRDAGAAPRRHFLFTMRARITAMPKKPGKNSEFVMFDVIYEDGSQRSNRRVPRELLDGLDGDNPALGFLIEQDRDIAEKSGRSPLKITQISRSGEKPKKMMRAG